jgi:hypothetical protein
MLIAIYPLAIAIAGLLLWAMASNPKAQEAGRILFFCGTFTLVQALAHSTFRIGDSR